MATDGEPCPVLDTEQASLIGPTPFAIALYLDEMSRPDCEPSVFGAALREQRVCPTIGRKWYRDVSGTA